MFRISQFAVALTLLLAVRGNAVPRQRADAGGRWQQSRISAGNAFACALAGDGTVKCWGDNSRGQLGNGSSARQTLPVRVNGFVNAISVAAGAAHACALAVDGRVRCWGLNSSGQLGDGTLVDKSVATAVAGLSRAIAVTAGIAHTCALLVDGTVSC